MRNIIIGTIILMVLVFGGTIGWSLTQKQEIPAKEAVPEEEIPSEENIVSSKEETPAEEEKFGLAAKILKVDIKNNLLIVEDLKDQRKLKINISDTTELIEIEIPKNALETGRFVPIKTAIELSDFQEERIITVRTSESISGENDLDNVIWIHLYPK